MPPVYAFKDFTGWEFRSRPEYTFPPGTIFEGCCLSQESLDSDIFPDGTTGLIFKRCNLDNVTIPPDSTVDENCSVRRFEIQNDLRDWEIADSGAPYRILNEKDWQLKGYSVDPADIPGEIAIHVDEMRLDVLSGEKTIEDVLGAEFVAQLTEQRDAIVAAKEAALDAEPVVIDGA